MNRRGSIRWSDIQERTSVSGIRLLFLIAHHWGRWPFRIILYPILVWYILTSSIARYSSRDYLRKVLQFQERRRRPGFLDVLKHFAAFGESLLDRLLLWTDGIEDSLVNIHGQEILDDFQARGQGCLLVCAHMGNLELCKFLSKKRSDIRVTMLVHTLHSQNWTRLLKKTAKNGYFEVMQVTEITPAEMIVLADEIQRGSFVVIAGDRVPVINHANTVSVPFLGDNAQFPIGPWIMGALLNCPVCLMTAVAADGKYEVYFESFRDKISIPRKDRKNVLCEIVSDYARRLEFYCQKYPYQWFNFYPFWEKQKG